MRGNTVTLTFDFWPETAQQLKHFVPAHCFDATSKSRLPAIQEILLRRSLSFEDCVSMTFEIKHFIFFPRPITTKTDEQNVVCDCSSRFDLIDGD